jgi:hypothetical protein
MRTIELVGGLGSSKVRENLICSASRAAVSAWITEAIQCGMSESHCFSVHNRHIPSTNVVASPFQRGYLRAASNDRSSILRTTMKQCGTGSGCKLGAGLEVRPLRRYNVFEAWFGA